MTRNRREANAKLDALARLPTSLSILEGETPNIVVIGGRLLAPLTKVLLESEEVCSIEIAKEATIRLTNLVLDCHVHRRLLDYPSKKVEVEEKLPNCLPSKACYASNRWMEYSLDASRIMRHAKP